MLSQLLVLVTSAVLASAQFGPPPTVATCTSSSFTIPSWFVKDLRYASASGNASFHLINRATNYTADLACQVGGNGWSACSIQGSAWTNETLKASIQVTGMSAQVIVNQTWTCNERAGSDQYVQDHVLP
jgi:hypothetical protein